MKKHIKINGLDVAIYENVFTGFPVIFVHGNSLSAQFYEKQLESDILKEYRLISFDLPGHGNSSKPSNPENVYSFSGLTNIIKGIIAELKLENVVLVGHSMGGHIAIQTLNKIPAVAGILVVGTPPIQIPPRFDLAFNQVKEVEYLFSQTISNNQATEIANALSENPELQEKIKTDIVKTDPDFRTLLFQSIGEGKYEDELLSLNKFSGLKCVMVGEEDELIQKNYIKDLEFHGLWNQSLIIVKKSGHLFPFENSLDFNKILLDFLNDVRLKNRKETRSI